MAINQTLEVPQGATWILSFQCEIPGEPNPSFAGWRVLFIAKKKLTDVNADALFNIEVVPESVTGIATYQFDDEATSAFEPGFYSYQAVAVDADGNVGKSEVRQLVIDDTVYKGAIT